MTYPIKYFSLQKQELEYEVELRGGAGESVQELRKQINKLCLLLPPEEIEVSHLEPIDDLKGVKESLLKSQNNLESLKIKIDKNLFGRTEALLHHIYHRLTRIQSNSDVADVYKICKANFHSQYKELSSIRSQASLPKPSCSTVAENVSDPATITVNCERSLSADIAKLKFSGKTCVRSFILKVEEYVQSRGIPFEKILSLAFEIFTDDALHWYRCNKDKIDSWPSLCELLKEDFSSSDYDYKLAAEIRARTQGESENITIYLSYMHGLFSRLGKPLSEEEKLEILTHNIRPCYANTLASCPNIRTIDALKAACRSYEDVQARFSNFQEPPRITPNTLAPELAYNPGTSSGNTKIKQQQFFLPNYRRQSYNTNSRSWHQNNNVATLSPITSRSVYCPRCRSETHSLRECNQKRYIICFKCGKKDVRFPECPVCNPNKSLPTSKN